MIDKVQKIREEVEKLKSQLLRGACSSQIATETICKEEAYNEVLAILDTMQEEPVKIKKGCKYRCLSDMVNNDTGKLSFIRGKIYIAPEDDTLVSEENGWLCDTSENASNFELVEEPVSNPIDFEKELYKAFGQVKDFTLGMRIAKWFYDMGKNSQEPVSKELDEAAVDYAATGEVLPNGKAMVIFQVEKAFRAGAKWGINREKAEIQAQSMALAHGCPKEHISEELEEAAKNVGQKYFPNEDNIWARPNYEAVKAECAFKDGANWQKEKTLKESEDAIQYVKENHSPNEVSDFQNAMNIAVMKAFDAGKEKMREQMMAKAVDVEVKVDAGGYPYIPAIELYDYDNDVPLAKEGDKVKVKIVKKD